MFGSGKIAKIKFGVANLKAKVKQASEPSHDIFVVGGCNKIDRRLSSAMRFREKNIILFKKNRPIY